MIRYTLQCADKHPFDGWFANSGAFDSQVERGLVVCPSCGSTDVRKAIMAPNVSPRTRAKGRSDTPSTAPAIEGATSAPSVAPSPVPVPVTNAPEALAAEKVVAFFRAVRQVVEAKAENVGDKFAEEARKIHYGETEEKPIYGEATLDDAQELLEEGIMVHPLPQLPEDKN